MSEFRQALYDDSDRPPDLSPEVALLVKRQAGAAVLLERGRELYPELLERFHAEGPSPELSELALEAAGDLGAVMQSLRARPELIQALADHPKVTTMPMIVFDQLQFSYLLLADGATEKQRKALLTREELDELLENSRVTDWLAQFPDPPASDAD